MNISTHWALALALSAFLLGACQTTNQRVLDAGGESQLQRRAYQSRSFETADKEKVLRGVITTLQDLRFVIDKADLMLGTVSGTRFDMYTTKISVSVRPKGNDRVLVRANVQVGLNPVEDPKTYQDFYAALEKSLFLTAHVGE